jgi:2-amino-4-hydroxy-6-hydroxymethyldihydropteridine diphosphokinase
VKPESEAYIGLGSNLEDPATQISSALESLTQSPQISDVICAPWYQSQAIGPGEQPDYINTVVKLSTSLSPHGLLKVLQDIENQQGRQRSIRWGARTIDLDLLLYNNEELNSQDLVVPHPELKNRAFVLLPLYDLKASLVLPSGERLAELVKVCDKIGLNKIKET